MEIKVDLNLLKYYSDLSKADLFILLSLTSYANSKGIIYLNKAIKEDIARELGLSLTTVNICIYNLARTKFLKKIDYSTYMVNPIYFWLSYYGENDRDKAIENWEKKAKPHRT